MTTARRLQAVPTRTSSEDGCRVLAQAVLSGPFEYQVQGVTPLAGPGRGHVSVRFGRVILVLEDREAYEAACRAWSQVEAVVDQALPRLPAPQYRPRSGR